MMRPYGEKVYVPQFSDVSVTTRVLPLGTERKNGGCVFGMAMDTVQPQLLAVFSEIFSSFAAAIQSYGDISARVDRETVIAEALQNANDDFFAAVEHGRIILHHKNMHLLLGIALLDTRPVQVFFSGTGDLTVWTGDGANMHTGSELIATSFTENGTEPFAQMDIGNIPPHHVIIISTSDLFTHLPPQVLAQQMRIASPAIALEQCHNYLQSKHAPHALPILLITTPDAASSTPSPSPAASRISLQQTMRAVRAAIRVCATFGKRAGQRLLHRNHATKKSATTLAPAFPTLVQKGIQKSMAGFRRFSIVQRTLLSICAALVLILLLNLGTHTSQKIQDARDQLFTDLQAQIAQHQESAQAARIYGNEQEALANVKQALVLTKQLPTVTAEQQTYKAETDQHLTKILHDLQHVFTVNNPTLLFDFSGDGFYGLARPNLLVRIDEEFVVYDPSYEALWRIAFATTSVPQRTVVPSVYALVADDARILAISSENGTAHILNIATDGTRTTLGETTIIPPTPQGFAMYHNNLYLLDAEKAQLYKMFVSAQGLGVSSPWLQEHYDTLAETNSIAIDGDIYFATAKTLVKYTRGTQASFTFTQEYIDPPLQGMKQVKTERESDSLYLLEAAGKRLIILTKKGVLEAQYLFNNRIVHAFALDEASRKGYVLIDHGLYAFPLDHLKTKSEE